MGGNEIEKLLKGLKPISEIKKAINRQAESLSKDELLLLSPLLKEVNSHNRNMSIEELLKKADNIKKLAQNASKHNNNKP